MTTTTLQIPLSKALKNEATSVAKEYGFSSLQEVLRFILTKFAKREIGITLEQFPAVLLSVKNEKRYSQMDSDFKLEKNVKTAKNVNQFLQDIAS